MTKNVVRSRFVIVAKGNKWQIALHHFFRARPLTKTLRWLAKSASPLPRIRLLSEGFRAYLNGRYEAVGSTGRRNTLNLRA